MSLGCRILAARATSSKPSCFARLVRSVFALSLGLSAGLQIETTHVYRQYRRQKMPICKSVSLILIGSRLSGHGAATAGTKAMIL